MVNKEESIKKMGFHEPDPRWDAFGCPTFESYLNAYLLRSKFHKNVPKQITESYITIEHLIAHAYYFYPMYDEAISKLLRTMEMAVKIKCQQLNISTIVEKKKNKNGCEQIVKYDRAFKELIDDVCKAEPKKNLSGSMHRIRELRNMNMHPEQNSYAGGIGMPSVYSCILLLNMLFAEEAVFSTIRNTLEAFHKQILPLKDRALSFHYGTEKILIYDFDVLDSIVIDGKPRFFLCARPVLEITEEIENEKKVTGIQPICIWVDDLEISKKSAQGVEVNNKIRFKINIIDTEKEKGIINRYKKYIQSIHMANSFMVNSEISRSIAKFRYAYYDRLCA